MAANDVNRFPGAKSCAACGGRHSATKSGGLLRYLRGGTTIRIGVPLPTADGAHFSFYDPADAGYTRDSK